MSKTRTFAQWNTKALAAKRDLIIDAAERVFAAKPFPKVSIRDIASEAGISHATIYRYFPDQQTLFLEAFMRGMAKILALVDTTVSESDASRVLPAIVEGFITFLSENDHYFRMMTHFMLDGNLTAPLLERLNSAERTLLDKLEAMFIARGAPEDTRALAHAFFAALNGILISFRNYPGRDRKAVLSHMHTLGRVMAMRFQ